ncbi:MAG: hypothetical protein OXR64_12205 [Chloroflexota bacterium]|nr:hypothetical protein [Chloroflexota bacterium]MDE2920587.1 hypothetical protein [Chloroflexota bacterium]
MARIIPRTLKGKILAALLGVAIGAILGLVLLVVFWTWLSWVLVAAFVLYGAVVTLLAVGLLGYLVWNRQKLTALRLDWIDSEAHSRL